VVEKSEPRLELPEDELEDDPELEFDEELEEELDEVLLVDELLVVRLATGRSGSPEVPPSSESVVPGCVSAMDE
jgi:hypothetical protein